MPSDFCQGEGSTGALLPPGPGAQAGIRARPAGPTTPGSRRPRVRQAARRPKRSTRPSASSRSRRPRQPPVRPASWRQGRSTRPSASSRSRCSRRPRSAAQAPGTRRPMARRYPTPGAARAPRPPQSAPPQSAPPQSAPPQSAPPQSAPRNRPRSAPAVLVKPAPAVLVTCAPVVLVTCAPDVLVRCPQEPARRGGHPRPALRLIFHRLVIHQVVGGRGSIGQFLIRRPEGGCLFLVRLPVRRPEVRDFLVQFLIRGLEVGYLPVVQILIREIVVPLAGIRLVRGPVLVTRLVTVRNSGRPPLGRDQARRRRPPRGEVLRPVPAVPGRTLRFFGWNRLLITILTRPVALSVHRRPQFSQISDEMSRSSPIPTNFVRVVPAVRCYPLRASVYRGLFCARARPKAQRAERPVQRATQAGPGRSIRGVASSAWMRPYPIASAVVR